MQGLTVPIVDCLTQLSAIGPAKRVYVVIHNTLRLGMVLDLAIQKL